MEGSLGSEASTRYRLARGLLKSSTDARCFAFSIVFSCSAFCSQNRAILLFLKMVLKSLETDRHLLKALAILGPIK